ncbi:TPA_asm: hypothetical protein G1X19_10895 [Salmonella enterica subsp. enterica serovar Typhimurium str. SL1344]|uniref:Fimbrial protein n=1 Tax=Salmonella typhimurium (strain SL1344) TaxID=216597 RepID=A0A718W833_SALTS|nr:hypothetical protein [Salmonella enterica subsp. enterica serovar Typhimurium str. SL1344]HAD6692702.1 hypothetical protein [Salmonella enterica subsp. enterica serovar Typhimurium str. SL1344]HAD6716151.1 hypothetical protein [Salmonella enterica subsp. enterica serovar Typhimurium str. SL1344]
MKTSIYLLTVLLVPTATNAYTYTRDVAQLTIEGSTKTDGNIELVDLAGGPVGSLKTGKVQLPISLPIGTSTYVSPSNAYSSFNKLATDETDLKFTLNMPGTSPNTRSNITYDLLNGKLLERPNTIKWEGSTPGSNPYFTASCDTPTTMNTSDFHKYGFTGTFDTAVQFIDRDGSSASLTLNIVCWVSYRANADISLRLNDDTLSLSGVAGSAQSVQSSMWVKSDPGRIRITFQNPNPGDIRVSFEQDKNKPQTTLTITKTSEITLPFYVSTLNTSAGSRTYTVNVNAEFT